MFNDTYTFVPPTNDELWKAYHDIRRTVLFEAHGKFGVYDANHPDEYLPQNHPFLLLHHVQPIGVVRIDLPQNNHSAFFRRVAIIQSFQRSGHGSILMKRAEDFALSQGRRYFVANVALDAVPFYQKLGYRLDASHPENNPKHPRMIKER